MSKLLIVESPTKARTIGRMLGKGYKIIASMGHVRDLPERELGVDIGNGFTPQYVDTPRSRSVIKELRTAAKNAEEIYLAPDPDREGEAIAWHLEEVLKKGTAAPFFRVTFHEITRSAIEKALQQKGMIDLKLVDAQQARRVLDRIVGYQVSPLLWSRIEKGSSAGRVQSAALRLVVERERAINAFLPEEYWVFELVFRTDDGAEFAAKLFKVDSKDFKVSDVTSANALLEAVTKGTAPQVNSVTGAERRRNAPPPFTTSTLQQSANTTLHYTATTTMRCAQSLYEGVDIGEGGAVGLITYMRTDSVNIAREAQIAAADFIRTAYGTEFVPNTYNVYRSKGSAQEAHEAIRPTDVRRTPELMAPYLDSQQQKLYSLIWRRFVASQMAPAIQRLTTVDVLINGSDGKGYTFRATATVPLFAGFTRIYEENSKKKDDSANAQVLAALKENQPLTIADARQEQKFTEPPPRYSEAALIKELEENGIGRPSTYATILRTIQDRKYVEREQGKLYPSELGFSVNDFLVGKLPELFDINFTANMEKQLDEVEEGKIGWVEMMTEFYAKFAPWLASAKTSDAVPQDEADRLLGLFNDVAYEAPRKVGKRTYDDGKFVKSVLTKYQGGKGHLSAKQYQALLVLAAKYQLRSADAELQSRIDAVAAEQTEKEEKRIQAESAAPTVEYETLFKAFDNVTFEPAVKRGRSSFDDKKFFTSLKQQALAKGMLSEKQLGVLKRLAAKYRGELTDTAFVDSVLGVPEAVVGNESKAEAAAPAASAADPTEALEILKQVKTWAEPVKKGRFTYDDKQFYESIAKQHAAGKALSARQVAAIIKLAEKYKA